MIACATGALSALLVALALAAPSPSGAAGDRAFCGSFSYSPHEVRVYRVRGGIECERLRHVMQRLFNGKDTGRWDCIGPQTGYAACERGRHKMVAKF